jgi:hypothetical protein
MNTTTPPVPPIVNRARQKLVTLYLDNTAYAKSKMLVGSFADKHSLVEEHLGSYLDAGWRIAQVQAFGGGSDALAVRGWVVVVLEQG